MNVYFDTSAIVKLFSVESGTEEVSIADKDWLFVSSDKVQAELVKNIGFNVYPV